MGVMQQQAEGVVLNKGLIKNSSVFIRQQHYQLHLYTTLFFLYKNFTLLDTITDFTNHEY